TTIQHSIYAQRHPTSFPTRRSSDLRQSEKHRPDHDRQRRVLVILDLLADRERNELGDDPEGDAEDDQTEQRVGERDQERVQSRRDRKSTRLNSSHLGISYAVFCLKK